MFFKNQTIVGCALLALTMVGVAHADDLTPAYQADLKVTPVLGPHKNGITGQLAFMQDKAAMTQVKLTSDKPIFGKSEFLSAEQVIKLVDVADGTKQFGAAFKFKGVPHPFYFVFLAYSKDGGSTFSGKLFRVDGKKLEELDALLGAPIPQDPTPAGFKAMSEGVLKKL